MMAGKIVALVSLLLLPFSASLWYTSHRYRQVRRYDATLYKSLEIHLKKGKCGLSLLSMPTKTASRSEFAEPSDREPWQLQRTILLTSWKSGVNRITWLVFPLWLPTAFLATTGTVPLVHGPLRRWRRKRNGWCLECGYNLTGNRSGRCSECGTPFRRVRRK